MSFHVEQQDNYQIISFTTDKLDAVVSPDLKSELVVINKNGTKNIILDLASVRYCDSSGLSALLIGQRVCTESNGSFILCGLQPIVQKLITISQLDTVLTITATLPEAIDQLFVEESARNGEDL